MNKVKITIVGAGYVGMSLAVLLAKHHEIKVLDIDSRGKIKLSMKDVDS